MRQSTELKFRKYAKGYGFLSFAGKYGDIYGKKLMNTATKTGIDAAKTASKSVVQKTAEATGDLIGNQNNNNNLNYLIDPIFTNVNRLFVLSYKRIEEDNVERDYRDSFSHNYVP